MEPTTANIARKYDAGKERFDLIPAAPLLKLAEVFTFGVKKYDDRNWENGMKWGRIFAAIMRHLWKWWKGEKTDAESGLSHLAHAAWGCFVLLEYEVTHPEQDDRQKNSIEAYTLQEEAKQLEE